MTLEAPFPSPVFSEAALGRFDLLLAGLALETDLLDELGTGSAEFFGADFGAVVFAITLFLCV
jgi:hypothetical protein